jgi:CubicO group peptidase (beta-lactamase class C family)
VSDAINKHLSDCPEAWRDITVHQLLTHTSGLPEFSDLPGFDEKSRAFADEREFVARLANAPMQFAPGQEHEYANSNYVLLGYIIEAVSGSSYREFLQQRICKPLNLANTGCDQGAEIIDRRAFGYTWKKQIVPAEYWDMRNNFASGDAYSTAEDLFHFVEGLTGGKLLTKASLDAMLNAHASGYGYGWYIANLNNRRMIRHGGGMSGVSTDLRYLPDDRICVVVLSNIDVTKASRISDELLKLSLGETLDATTLASPIDVVQKLEASPGDATIAKSCVGTYVLPMGELVVTAEGSKLFVKGLGDPERAELLRESGMTFFIRGPAALQLKFAKNAQGQVDRVHATVRGREFLGKKTK